MSRHSKSRRIGSEHVAKAPALGRDGFPLELSLDGLSLASERGREVLAARARYLWGQRTPVDLGGDGAIRLPSPIVEALRANGFAGTDAARAIEIALAGWLWPDTASDATLDTVRARSLSTMYRLFTGDLDWV